MKLEDIVDKNKSDFWMFSNLSVEDLQRQEPVAKAYVDRLIGENKYNDREDFTTQYQVFFDRVKSGEYKQRKNSYTPVILNEH